MRSGGARSWPRAAAWVAVVAAIAASCTGEDGAADRVRDAEGAPPFSVEVVSSRPEYVTGGHAVVQFLVDEDVDPAEVIVWLGELPTRTGGSPARSIGVGATVYPDQPGRLLLGITGLPEGRSVLTAEAGGETVELEVTNHPTQGPLFSGEQRELVSCTTETFGLAPSTPVDGCFAPTVISWQYVDTAGTLRDLADPTAPPADAEMVEVDGEPVPFVLRHETGVLNRSVYRITLFQPQPDPLQPDSADISTWNERLVYRFGGGCGAIPTQGYLGTGTPSLELLRRGYATATATFNTFQVVCNDLVSAETASMVKERFAEAYGVPDFTIGEGGSGGAIQQILLAQNQPGLLDAIAPSVPFPDALSISGGIFDCALLTNYYATPAGSQLGDEQRTAVNGHAVAGTCGLWDTTFATTIDPAAGCRFDVGAAFGASAGPSGAAPPGLSPEAIYDPVTNPDGLRCTVWETNVSLTGRDPATGFARPGYDNQGVQYGLDALNAGVIGVDQFLDLNQAIGGFDIDGQPQADRSVVDEELVRQAYATGRVSGPWGGLPDTPIILLNVYTDPMGDIHDRVRSFSLLDRLAGPDGEWPATVSLWTIGSPEGSGLLDTLTGALGDRAAEPTFVLDAWLTAAAAHEADQGGTWADALAATKPASAESRCLVQGEEPIEGPEANDDAACVDAFPIHEEPRMAAGGPRRGDVLKCQLVPTDEAAELYEVDFTEAQRDRLAEVFPDGVCDWSQPSVGFSEPETTWPDLDP